MNRQKPLKSAYPKPEGLGLQIRTFLGSDGETYLVYRTPKHSFHVFVELQAKKVAEEAFGIIRGTTRERWEQIWADKKA